MERRVHGFTLVELLTTIGIASVLAVMATGAGMKVYESSSVAVSANNIRQLAAGCSAYLADNNHTFWKYRETVPGEGIRWWFGVEPVSSLGAGEGKRIFHPERGPLGPYVPAGFQPDPSFSFTGKAFKPKYRAGYIGMGYNVLLADKRFFETDGAESAAPNSKLAWQGTSEPVSYWHLQRPETTIVFATAAQVNNFQRPASAKNPMIEEFYGIDEGQSTVHGRHHGKAMVAYATGNVDLLPLDPETIDPRAPEANIGRFAPAGNTRFLR